MLIKDISKLKRKHDNAILLGCGPSIKDITDEHLKMMNNLDIWAINNFIIHKTIVPEYYTIEIKPHVSGPLWEYIIHEKKDTYKDTNWIVSQNKFLNYIPEKYFKGNMYKYQRQSDKYIASLSSVLANMYKFGYKKIYLMGIDLYSREYFWTNNKEYADVKIPEKMKACGGEKVNLSRVHPTEGRNIREYINKMSTKVKLINLSKRSLLNRSLDTLYFGKLNRARFFIDEKLKDIEDPYVIEVGSADGKKSALTYIRNGIDPYKYYALDVNKEDLENMKPHGIYTYHIDLYKNKISDVLDVDFLFNVGILTEVLEHFKTLKEQLDILIQLISQIKKEGTLLISYPATPNLDIRKYGHKCDKMDTSKITLLLKNYFKNIITYNFIEVIRGKNPRHIFLICEDKL